MLDELQPVVEKPAVDKEDLESKISSASDALLDLRQDDGHWIFELESDSTIPAEYLLMRFFLDEPRDLVIEGKVGNYLRRIQSNEHNGWALVHGGHIDISASVKAYFALKAIGDSADAPHMVRAREAILALGGAANSNVFTRFLLAIFDVTTWNAVPMLPVEIMFLPRWFPFHLSKVSYWARTTIVPLMVLQALQARSRTANQFTIDELFLVDPKATGAPARAPHQKKWLVSLFGGLDKALRVGVPLIPRAIRKRAIDKAMAFLEERLNGEDGIGAIFPPMVYALMAYDTMGYGPDYRPRDLCRRAIERLMVIKDDEAYCQPCVSPVWDTALSAHAMLETGGEAAELAAKQGLDWLKPRQVLDIKGDWALKRPDLRPGGWAFQYNNAHYPDLDDTAVVMMAMDRVRKASGTTEYDEAISRGREWILGMQSSDGGWAAFDVDNLEYYMNEIPFADHGAMLDPPTEDVTARCVAMLAQLGDTIHSSKPVADGVEYLRRTQLADGSWYGRWGLNYIYGTWSVMSGLNAAGVSPQDPMMQRAVRWLVSAQNDDGGWGESAATYSLDYKGYVASESTASQTGWALLALMAAGEAESPVVAKGVRYLMATQNEKGLWDELQHTGTGFPRIYYLRYHGYSKFFPLWAMARYRNLMSSNSKTVGVGM